MMCVSCLLVELRQVNYNKKHIIEEFVQYLSDSSFRWLFQLLFAGLIAYKL